jgi:hypothetical protein
MGKTIEVAADRAYDQTKTVLPAEVAQGVYMKHAPSLQSLKLMHLMIGKAGGRMADDVRHEMRLSDLKQVDGMRNHTRQTVVPLFEELAAAVLTVEDPEKMTTTVGGLLDQAKIDYRHEVSGDTLISWTFRTTFKEMARDSNHWAILDRQAVFHLGSKYSVLLFQHISSLTNLKHITSKRFTVADFRMVLGIPEGKLDRFSNLKQVVIVPTIGEINSDLTRLHLTATYHKIGRTVAEVEIAWAVKEDLTKVQAELDRPSVGRKARREGTAEAVAVSFPSSGSIKDTQPWNKIARDNAPLIDGRHVPDLRLLADSFRKWCGDKSIPLDATSIEKSFTTWCKNYSAR